MEADDRLPFFQLLDDTCDAISMRQPLSAGAKALMFQDLDRYPLELIEAALAAHRQDPQRGQWQPNTAHIEYQIDRHRRNNWLSADEAFGRLTFDEDQPVLLNQATAAAYAVAAPFMQQKRPDQNAARMAFRACYDRIMEQEKLAHRGPRYWVSPGGSIEEQNAVREEGVRLGLLNVTWAPAAAPQLGHSAPPPGAMEALKSFRLKSLPPPGAEE